MAKIAKAKAFANNEVAFIAWETDQVTIPGCLGFDIVRELLDAPGGQVVETKSLPAYVAFKDQANPDWRPQTTAVWPVQKYNWRDLTLRRRRDQLGTRPENEVVRYRIRAVGRFKPGLEAVLPAITSHMDAQGHWVPNTYQGTPPKLGYLTQPAFTNEVVVTRKRGDFFSTFTNGILSTQFLVRVLKEDGVIAPGELKDHLTKPGDSLRRYLSGDVMTTIREFLTRPSGSFHAALYELEDEELLDLLVATAPRMKLILSDSGGESPVFDTRNAYARAILRAVADQAGSSFTLQDRLFNGSGHIGHNKFVIWSDPAGVAQAVLTGSTNWTWSGVCGQSNNLVVIEDRNVAQAFLAYWQRLHANPLPLPVPTSAPNTGADQGDLVKAEDRNPDLVTLAGGAVPRSGFRPTCSAKSRPPGLRSSPSPNTFHQTWRGCSA